MPTQTEVFFERNDLIVSKTDLKGNLTYVNEIFLRISEYGEEELIGQPHSFIRHPSMPRCVFKLLWDRLQAGSEIFAYVKNMTKSGAYYWVLAHATPSITASGEVVSVMTNSFTASKVLAAAATAAAILAIAALDMAEAHQPLLVGAAALVGLIGLGAMLFGAGGAGNRSIAYARQICLDAAAGNFEARIINIEDKGELGQLFRAINNLIDRSDAYLRESAAAMDHVARGVFYRRIIETGTIGSFLAGARRINSAIDTMSGKMQESRRIVDKITHVMGSVSSAATELESTSLSMQSTAERASLRAEAATSGADQASTSVGTVAA
ncbi:MAG: methyl-accepting chemotaxis protein, partial [Rhodospirillaceae bacterium]|nr:methyl-accepting chemotaxis protein [Rhodospirillaceae bacterium]